MIDTRPVQQQDLDALLELYRLCEVSAATESRNDLESIWEELLSSPATTVFVASSNGMLTATCTLITAANLLRNGQRHAFLENVVTHPAFRGKGHGRAVVDCALHAAWQQNCHHVLLQSGRPDERVHRFYQKCGFEPGIRTAYVARNPLI